MALDLRSPSRAQLMLLSLVLGTLLTYLVPFPFQPEQPPQLISVPQPPLEVPPPDKAATSQWVPLPRARPRTPQAKPTRSRLPRPASSGSMGAVLRSQSLVPSQQIKVEHGRSNQETQPTRPRGL